MSSAADFAGEAPPRALVVHRQGDAAGNRLIRELALRLALDAAQSLSAQVQKLQAQVEGLQAENERLRVRADTAEQQESLTNDWAWSLQEEMHRMREDLPHGLTLGLTIDGQVLVITDLHSDADRDPGDEQSEARS